MDSNPGTQEEPLRTIQAGVMAAVEQGVGAVYVAEGTYSAIYDDGAEIVMQDGVSIYGGYSAADWDLRDPDGFPSNIVDNESSSGNGLVNPSRLVTFPAATGSQTRLDGVTVLATGGGALSGVVFDGGAGALSNSTLRISGGQLATGVAILGGQPLLEDNRISVDNQFTVVRGVYCEFAAPDLQRNDIRASLSQNTLGIDYRECDGDVSHNLIVADEPASTHAGGSQSARVDGSPTMTSNTLVAFPNAGLAGTEGVHIRLDGSQTQPVVANNNFVQVEGITHCIQAADTASLEPTFNNNNATCDVVYSRSGPFGAFIDTIAELESEFSNASDNVRLEPAFTDAERGNWGLPDDGSAPCALTRGGLNLGGTTDVVGTSRTDPWSIGAYEVDGACL